MEETLLQLDKAIFTFINAELSSLILDSILIPLRHKMFWIPLYLFIAIFIFLNFPRERWLIFLGLALTVALSDGINSHYLKKEFERIRPCHCEELEAIARIPCGYGFSFPSSHATNHFGIAAFLIFLFSFTKWRWLFLLWALIISFAQVYVGVHYPGDVIAGGVFGFLFGGISFLIYIRISNKLIYGK